MKEIFEKIDWCVDLLSEEVDLVVLVMMSGNVVVFEIIMFLLGFWDKGEMVDEVVGVVIVLWWYMILVVNFYLDVVDICGMGGVGSGIFNVSMIVVIIVVGVGVRVVKYGNCKVLSKSGFVDVFFELGLNFDVIYEIVEWCFE